MYSPFASVYLKWEAINTSALTNLPFSVINVGAKLSVLIPPLYIIPAFSSSVKLS